MFGVPIRILLSQGREMQSKHEELASAGSLKTYNYHLLENPKKSKVFLLRAIYGDYDLFVHFLGDPKQIVEHASAGVAKAMQEDEDAIFLP